MKKRNIILQLLIGSLLLFLITGCRSYKQNIMLQTGGASYKEIVESTTNNYIIQPGDMVEVDVYSNKGELIVDPNFQLRKDLGAATVNRVNSKPSYLVSDKGYLTLPMIDTVSAQGLNKLQLDSVLCVRYSDYYVEAFAVSRVVNRRVVVLGATGGEVVILENENMNVLEVLALAGGLENNAKAHNIRLVRGDLDDPQVEVLNLATIEGMKKATMTVQPNDVIYVEPVRKVLSEGIRDVAPLVTLLTSMFTLLILINRTNN